MTVVSVGDIPIPLHGDSLDTLQTIHSGGNLHKFHLKFHVQASKCIVFKNKHPKSRTAKLDKFNNSQ